MGCGPKHPAGLLLLECADLIRSMRAACDELIIAGSYRRGHELIGDLDIVVRGYRHAGTHTLLKDSSWQVLEWGYANDLPGQRLQSHTESPAKIDIFIVDHAVALAGVLAYATGPVEFGRMVDTKFGRNIWRRTAGAIGIDFATEEDFFLGALEIPYQPPEERDDPAWLAGLADRWELARPGAWAS